ncbi:unnamed protein product, partial [Nesidiocoris tenuis]
MHEKEDELFLHLEKAIRLEEDCEKKLTAGSRLELGSTSWPPRRCSSARHLILYSGAR